MVGQQAKPRVFIVSLGFLGQNLHDFYSWTLDGTGKKSYAETPTEWQTPKTLH